MPRRNRVHLYTVSWNEQAMLGYFFRHYDRFVDRYVFYDDGSDDGTRERLEAHPRVEIRRFERTDPESFILSARALYDRHWKESRGAADWVIVGAVDEHLWHPHFEEYLAAMQASGVTAIPGLGFEMTGTSFPGPDDMLVETSVLGVPEGHWNKLNLFDPNAIEETHYAVGRHTAAPTGRVVYPDRDEVLLLHYKYLSIDYVAPRHALLATGLGPTDRRKRWGHQFDFDREQLLRKIADLNASAMDVPGLGPRADAVSMSPRWWRPESA
jgi:Glycosyl transferase family 2